VWLWRLSIRLVKVVGEICCLEPLKTMTPPPCNVRCGKMPIVHREIYMHNLGNDKRQAGGTVVTIVEEESG
jgi:hypothetical protein